MNEDAAYVFYQVNDRITDLMLRVHALQSLLQQSGVFTSTMVEQRVAEFRAVWDSRFPKHLTDALEQETRALEQKKQELLRQLLEQHEGTKQ